MATSKPSHVGFQLLKSPFKLGCKPVRLLPPRALTNGRKRFCCERKHSSRCVVRASDDGKGGVDEEEERREEARRKALNMPIRNPRNKSDNPSSRPSNVKKDGPDDFGPAGSLRGGKYGLGPQTDKVLNAGANETGLLVAAVAVLILLGALIIIGPPPQSALSKLY
mmetsp:Transcript_24001/g.40257  ORF Transcript_24001/g.40257 Transcript_24001/m.40257 type:complete len:166 (+) Transcript_24001:102-599(+)|eukprot:CAMPEP_0198209818 /NCGR_PEP_ID=MMETSP1445-20131203/17749_1 /TAXON_ID=36898 /ORGANISM="Pyramimonas sp., Strain CCMP2087" /LENGTH=165 /DNA_ID=CAMNT_0043883705 /DNA_START=99 /DNA_END=596 /DNA_ORIENTATION=+